MIDLKVRRVHYTLLYDYTEPTDIRWTYVEGDLRDVCGSYTFRDTGTAGLVEARYTLQLDFGFSVPALIRDRLQRQVMRRSVRELNARVQAEG